LGLKMHSISIYFSLFECYDCFMYKITEIGHLDY